MFLGYSPAKDYPAPDPSLTNALQTGLNGDPGTTGVSSIPKFFVLQFPRIILGLNLTLDFSEGWLETFRAAQLHFLICLIVLLVWYQMEGGVPQGPLALCCQR